MATQSPILVGPNGELDSLFMFTVGSVKRNYRVSVTQSAFGAGFTEYGERSPEPLSITLRGPIFGSSSAEYAENKNKIYRLLNRKKQWLRVGSLQIPLGSLTNDAKNWEDLYQDRVDDYEFEVNVLSPYWEEATPKVHTEPDTSGSGSIQKVFTVESFGTAPTYPTVRFTATSQHSFEVVVNGRTIRYGYSGPEGQRLYLPTAVVTVDSRNGWVDQVTDGQEQNLINQLSPDSQFGVFYESTPAGSAKNVVVIRSVGLNPNKLEDVSVTFTERYY